MKIKDNKGVALVTTLYFSIILYALSSVFIAAVVSEKNASRADREISKSFYAAQGGAQAALNKLDVLINTDLKTTISSASASGVVSYAKGRVNAGDGIGWLVYSVREQDAQDIDGDGDLEEYVLVLTQDGDQAEYAEINVTLGESSYSYDIILTEKSDPVSVGTDVWDFPYSYQIESTGTENGYSSSVKISGDFTVRVQKDNFAKYALFTNKQETSSGTEVWFTDKTNFSGPLHTNDRFNFAWNPGATFDGLVQQDEQTARFYNNGWSVLVDSDHNGTTDVPTFNAGFTRNVDEITISTASSESQMVTQVKGSKTYSSNGIYVPYKSGELTGGVYVKGDCGISLGTDAGNNAVYTIIQGSTTKTVTVNLTTNQTTVSTSGGSTTVYDGKPNGADGAGSIIYVDGNITSLAGTVQDETELTIASKNDMKITNNILYSDYDPGSGTSGASGYVPPSVIQSPSETKNLLGLVSWNGDVEIAASTPSNVTVHGTVLAYNGVFAVDNYDSRSPSGTATILGGVITDDYGAFGTFNSSTGVQVSGYGRNFVYDERMANGNAPPYFPTLNTFIAFTNDIADKMVWQEGE